MRCLRIVRLLFTGWLLFQMPGCSVDEPCGTCSKTFDARVIGFSNCGGLDIESGWAYWYFLSTASLGDTVVTSSLPDTLFTFPPAYFYGYRESHCFFPDSAVENYDLKIRFDYVDKRDEETVYCHADRVTCVEQGTRQIVIRKVVVD